MRLLYYILWLTKEIFLSSMMVTKSVWSKDIKKLTPVIDFVSTELTQEISRVIYANSITLTPGTISVSLEKDRILVHSLTKEGTDLAPMQQEIKKIFK